jgi:hypothetical protein
MKIELRTKNSKLFPMLKVPVVSHSHPSAKQLTIHSLLIYGYLIFLARKEKGGNKRRLSRALHIDPATTDRHLQKLATAGLVARDGTRWFAAAPSGPNQDLFKRIPNPKKSNSWWDVLAYDKLYLPTEQAVTNGLSIHANQLYWRLVRWAKQVQNGGGVIGPGYHTCVSRLNLKYLSVATNTNSKTVSRSLEALRQLKLIKTPRVHGHYFAVGIAPLDDQQKKLWRWCWQQPREQLCDLDYFDTRDTEPLIEEPACIFTEWLERYFIVGQVQEDILGLARDLQIPLDEFVASLRQADADNRANRVAGKSRYANPGLLFRHVLHERRAIERARRTTFIPEQRDWEGEEVCRIVRSRLSVRKRCSALLQEAVKKQYVETADGSRQSFSLRWQDVKEALQESNGDLERFKEKIACQVIRIDITPEGACPWLDQWRKLRPVPYPEYRVLKDLYSDPDGELYSTIEVEINDWAREHWDDETDAQVHANELVAGIVRICSPNKEKITEQGIRKAFAQFLAEQPAGWLPQARHPAV